MTPPPKRLVGFTEAELRRLLVWWNIADQDGACAGFGGTDRQIAHRIETVVDRFDEFTVHWPGGIRTSPLVPDGFVFLDYGKGDGETLATTPAETSAPEPQPRPRP